jgi:hypothetical protein
MSVGVDRTHPVCLRMPFESFAAIRIFRLVHRVATKITLLISAPSMLAVTTFACGSTSPVFDVDHLTMRCSQPLAGVRPSFP